jgi:hypothetical protein
MKRGQPTRMRYKDDLRSCPGTLTQGRPARPGCCTRGRYKEMLRGYSTTLRYEDERRCHVQDALQPGKAFPVIRVPRYLKLRLRKPLLVIWIPRNTDRSSRSPLSPVRSSGRFCNPMVEGSNHHTMILYQDLSTYSRGCFFLARDACRGLSMIRPKNNAKVQTCTRQTEWNPCGPIFSTSPF